MFFLTNKTMKYTRYTTAVVLAIVFCSSVSANLNDHVGSVSEITDLLQSGEEKRALSKLDSLHSAVVRKRAKLRGLTFSGREKQLTDPVQIPEGTYRVHFSTGQFGIVRVLDMKGKRKSSLFNVIGGGADDATTVYRSDGERVMIQFSNIRGGGFKLYFEKLN